MPRKLFFLSMAFIIGTALGLSPGLWVYGLGILLVLMLLQKDNLHATTLMMALLMVLIGIANGALRQPEILTSQPGEWRGRAISAPDITAGGSYRGLVRLEGTNSRVMLYYSSPWQHRDLLHIAGSVAEPLRAQNPGELDYQELLSRQGINGVVFATEARTLGRFPATPLDGLRSLLQENLSQVAEPAQGLARALVLGDRRGLSRNVQDQWRKAGASHLLAVSGLHVSIVGGMFYFIMRRFTGMRISWAVSAIIVVLYALIIGSSASAWRAAITFGLLALAQITLRTPDWMTTFSFVAALMLAIVPQAIGDPGFQLSFAAATGIVYLAPFFSRVMGKHLPRRLAQLLAVSVAAQLVTLPILSIHFHTIPLYGLVSSLLLVPLAPLLLIAGVVTAVLGGVPLLGQVFAGLFGLIAVLFTFMVSLVSSWPMASVNIVALPALTLIVFYALLWLWPHLPKRLLSSGLVLCALLVVVLTPVLVQSRQFSVTFLAVGNADAIHLKLGNISYLIDTADAGAMGRSVIPYLRSQGVNRLRGIFITHSHNDHVGGLENIVQIFPVAMIYSGPEVPVVEALAGEVPVMTIVDGLRVENPRYSISAMCSNNPRLNLNNRSAVLLLEHGDVRLLFAADLEAEGELELLPRFPPVHILKVGHHGSNTSSGAAFLKSTEPLFAAISVGANRYGHPSPEVVARLQHIGATVLRTDEPGAIRFQFSRGKINVQSFSNGKFSTIHSVPITPLRRSSNVVCSQLPAAS